MKKSFDQTRGSTAHTTNMLSLARSFGLHDNEVAYAKAGTKLVNIKGIYDSKSSTFWLLPELTGSEIFSFSAPTLITDKETLDLTAFNLKFENFYIKYQYDFSKGFELNFGTQLVKFNESLYRWDGSFPKVVPASSTPESTGGIGAGAWVSVDIISKIPFDTKQGKFSYSAIELGCVADRLTDNTAIIQDFVNKHEDEHIYLTIEPNVLWHFKSVAMKNGVNIIDMSGWDDEYSHWNEHIKYHFNHNTVSSQHNGNTFHVLGRHHPAIVVDNIGKKNDPEGEEHRASFIIRENGRLRALMGIGRTNTDSNFIIADNKLRTRFCVATTNDTDFELGFNSGPIANIDYTYGAISQENVAHRKYSAAGKTISEQYFAGGSNSVIITYSPGGAIQYTQNGSNTLAITESGQITGNKRVVTYASSLSVAVAQSGTLFVSHSGSASSGYTLPQGNGINGIYYIFVNTKGNNLTITTRSGETFIGGTSSKTLSTVGATATITSLGDGTWAIS